MDMAPCSRLLLWRFKRAVGLIRTALTAAVTIAPLKVSTSCWAIGGGGVREERRRRLALRRKGSGNEQQRFAGRGRVEGRRRHAGGDNRWRR